MAKINILDSKIYNRIAAGEVVENPKSVVKELVENCIDAGATSVLVEIEGGGMDYIRVTDNGIGMGREDLEKSVMPHATSKIGNLNDLNHISTLGFRGEALASIASVSKLKISSRELGSELGNYIEYDFGVLSGKGECGASEGTSVTVEKLFDKIPARKKFLRKAGSETADISNLILRTILANYNVSIKYVSDGTILYHSDGKGLQSAVYTAYGKEFSDNLVFVEQVMSDITIYGFAGKPNFSKHNRSYQTLIVNGRYVINNDITYLMHSCYKDFLMTRQFPVWVLFIDIPDDMVDVNVHPNKMDIKFADFGKVKKYLYGTAKEVVNSWAGVPKELSGVFKDADREIIETVYSGTDIKFDEVKNAYQENITDDAHDVHVNKESINLFKGKKSTEYREYLFSGAGISNLHNSNNGAVREKSDLSKFIENKLFVLNADSAEKSASYNEYNYNYDKHNDKDSDNVKQNTIKDNNNTQQNQANYKNSTFSNLQHKIDIDERLEIKVLCKIFNTYILLEYKNDIYIIDQHAAHERIIFDELMSVFDTGSIAIQPLLLPYIFDLPHENGFILTENIKLLEEMGFSVSQLSGNSYSLSSVPYNCVNIDCCDFIRYFFENLGKNILKESDLVKERIAKAACKAAVKGRDDLNVGEINALLDQLLKIEKLFCPHGRPIIIKTTKHEIEKWFKRVI